jgi:hypothetical protein
MQTSLIVAPFWIVIFILSLTSSSMGQGSRASQTPSTSGPSETTKTPRSGDSSKARLTIDFSGYAGEPIDEWLHAMGLKFEDAARDRDRLALSVHNDALVLEAQEQLRGFIIKDGLDLAHVSTVRIEWGVIKYPEGASYEQNIRNEAIMIYVFFGEEKISSGHLFYPDLPYFIGVYLCQNDRLRTPYKSDYYQEGGRFVCLGNPSPHETIVSEFDLRGAFQKYFEKTDVPPISGFAIEIDTSSSGDGGKASGYIRRLTFLE